MMNNPTFSEPTDDIDSNKRRLADLLSARSKHSIYQELHPWAQSILGPQYSPTGKRETLRWNYMTSHIELTGKSLLDIGANTGFFCLAALEQGAQEVHAFEGNPAHAEFIREIAALLGLSDCLTVYNSYFDFERQTVPEINITLCLNVLHHLGDDFGSQSTTLATAKQQMGEILRQLAKQTQYCWFQIGFNWKGDRNQPLFPNGRKAEIIEFVRDTCHNTWVIEDIAIYEPAAACYKPVCDALLQRFDVVGEFLNRPLFFLKSSTQQSFDAA
ncbi:bifunctional 2-polyprenyl-6-hydroxyphenol methylase/3-demethylubiquinol 3-O-methyltransferase UbiG [Desulfopila sp. IMCC35008]|uniref:class I SAM-dependent methyltransferase n=1 Tax=Desulfopila sp. IMCC35008 TaxID=2653858 RepID=UPI0013D5FCE9|nr:class I SAM-dependent methyltransferase [Desulfopila sp. IMCC35008]